MKRTLALLLVLLMAGSAMLSCSDATTDETTDAAAAPTADGETVPEETADPNARLDSGLGTVDYEGYNFNILSCNFYNRDSANLMMFDEVTGDPVNDVLFDAKCYIEDRFNVAVTWTASGDTAACATAFRNSVNGADHSFDISIGHDTETTNLTKEGLALNLNTIDAFNTSKPWWPVNTMKGLSIGDKMYCASTYLTYLGLHWTRILTVNKEMMDNMGFTIPYDMVREGKWTLDEFHSIIEGSSYDTNGNGKIDAQDEVGLASGGQTWYCMQVSAGLPIYEKDEYNFPYLNLDVEKADKFVQIMDKIINSDDYVASGDFGIEPFQNGKAMFAYTQVGDAYDYYRLTDVKYGFLPTPKLDELQENYINCCTDMLWAMPKTLAGEEAERAATIIEAFQCYNYNHMLPAYFEGALKARIADSPDDSEMMQLIADTRAISFAFNYALTFNNIIADCVLGTNNIASYFKSNEKVANKTLEKMIDKFVEME